MMIRFFFFMPLIFLLAGCSGKDVTVDYDPGYDIAAHCCFSIAPSEMRSNDPLNAERFERAIEELLREKGYRRDDRRDDFKVRYFTRVVEDVPSNVSIGFGFGSGGPGMGVGVGGTKRLTRDELRLGIEMIDTRTHRVFWSAGMKNDLDEQATPEAKTALIRQSVRTMLETYPKAKK